MIKKLLLFLVLILGSTFALTPPPDTLPIVPPKLTVDSGVIKLSKLHVSVEVTGNIAQTTYTMFFYNERNRVLEAQLEFPLPQGATVSRFAMDVNGALREAVSVEKQKGREIFEEIVRKNIDPGLLEKTKGNSYKARIYPVPAKGYKQVVIRYESELKKLDDAYLYNLPLNFTEKLDSFSVDIKVLDEEVTPTFTEIPEKAIVFKKWEKSWSASLKKSNYKANKSIQFVIPELPKNSTVQVSDDDYFYAIANPKLGKKVKEVPGSISLFWDVSTSSEATSKEEILALLKAYLTKSEKCIITITPFRNRILSSKKITVNKGDIKELKTYLSGLDYDGATQLGALDFTEDSSDEIILITDGISNFGKKLIKTGNTPIIIISNAVVTDHAYLQYLASSTGGVFVNLQQQDTKEALLAMTSEPLLFLGVEKKSGVTSLYPGIKQQVTGSFSLSGKLNNANGSVTLLFGYGKKVTERIHITVDKEKAIKSKLLPYIWAQKKLSDLSLLYDENKEEIDAHAREYNLVTKERSLIILDRVEDYVQYDITPPKELLEKFNTLKAQKEKEQKRDEKESVDKVLQKLQERLSWWKKDFDYKGCKKPSMKIKKSRVSRPREAMAMDMMAAPEEMERLEELNGNFESRGFSAPKKEKKESSPSGGSITLKKWTPDTPYLKRLKTTPKEKQYAIYLEEKKEYANSSAFFLDVADFFLEQDNKELALQVLSNIAEMKLENPQLLRILAHRLRQLGEYPLAIKLFTEVLGMRKEEPQSYRDLGLTYADNKEYVKSVEMLYKVAIGTWDSRFSDIDIIALNEMNGIIAKAQNSSSSWFSRQKKISDVATWLKKSKSKLILDERLIQNMPCDVRVVLNWDADNCDMDLWVTDPVGEKCFYSHKRTCIGGHMSNDFTQGYGPEEFLLKRAMPGEYKIEVNYYGNRQQTLAGATTVQVELITDFGKSSEKRKAITLRLKDEKEVVHIGNFSF